MGPALPRLFGRERELAALARALVELRPSLVVEGEVGVGKTRLCQEVERLARELGHRVAWGRPWEGGPPGWPWRQILRGLGASPDLGVEDVLGALVAAAPLVVVLDDAHRLDPVSREILARAVVAPGLLVIAAALPSARLGGQVGGLETLRVAPLDDDAVSALLAEVPELPDARARAIRARGAGYPLFLRALLHVDDPATEVPAEIASAVAAKLDALSGEAREAAEVAAVAGRTLAHRLVDAGALAELGDGILELDLGRDAIYRRIPVARRAVLHHEAARAAEIDRPPAEIALHARLGATVGGRAPVARWEYLAGQAAAARLDFDEAEAHFARALAAADVGTLAWCEIVVAAGTARSDAGDQLRVAELFAMVAPFARKHGQPRLLARMALSLGRRTFTPARPNQALVDYAREALAGLGTSEPALRARLLARLGSELSFSLGGAHVALTHEAIALARAQADPSLLAAVLVSAHTALWTPENLDERAAIADEIEALTASLEDPDLRVRGLHTRVIALAERGDLSGAERALAQCLALADERRDPTVGRLRHRARRCWRPVLTPRPVAGGCAAGTGPSFATAGPVGQGGSGFLRRDRVACRAGGAGARRPGRRGRGAGRGRRQRGQQGAQPVEARSELRSSRGVETEVGREQCGGAIQYAGDRITVGRRHRSRRAAQQLSSVLQQLVGLRNDGIGRTGMSWELVH
ncbi:MAG: AAA family ATPase, partial [Kofleriaceae bacterium]